MKSIIKLIRPHQYIKNIFIFLPLFFSGNANNGYLFVEDIYAFIAFSVSASAIYILNDYLDIEDDRRHPSKRFRPLVTGEISKNNAIILMLILISGGITIMGFLSLQALFVLVGYVTLNIAYSFYLKHIALIDVIIIAIGFVLRLFVGSEVTGIPLSMWIVIMTFLLALFMALAKRRDDVLVFLGTGNKMRKSIDGYNLQLIDGVMMIMASVVIVVYILYTTSVEVVQRLDGEYLYLSALFVILGIMRYLQITLVELDCGSPTKIVIKDKFMQVTILAWVLFFAWIIYA